VELLDTTAVIETPERVRFRHRVAGPGPRSLAWFIDFVARVLIGAVIGTAAVALSLVSGWDGIGTGLMLLFAFLLEWFYGAIFETLMEGRTPGKMVLSLRVVKEDGAPGRFPDFLLRNLLRAADFLPALFGAGVFVMLTDKKMRRIGDLVAGTVVVLEERRNVRGAVSIEPPVTEVERQELPARVDLSRQEIGIIEEFLRRRRELSPERAEELAWQFGPKLSERTGVIAPTWERVLTLAYARATGKDREP